MTHVADPTLIITSFSLLYVIKISSKSVFSSNGLLCVLKSCFQRMKCDLISKYYQHSSKIQYQSLKTQNVSSSNIICGCSFLLHFCDMLPAPESFCYKRFFQLCGLSSKTPKEIQEVFHILDDDDSGYFEESELKCVKQCCRECMQFPCRVMAAKYYGFSCIIALSFDIVG